MASTVKYYFMRRHYTVEKSHATQLYAKCIWSAINSLFLLAKMDSLFPLPVFQFQPQGKVSYCIICRLSVLCCNSSFTSLPVLDQPPFITPEISMSWLMCR